MKVKVFYEPANIFTNRLENFQDVLHLNEFIRVGDRKDQTIKLKENYDLLVINSNDLSGVNHHVMEGIERIITALMEQYNLDVYINNPTKTLLRTLKNAFEIEENEPYIFPNISEKRVVEIEESFDEYIIGQYSAKKRIARSLLRLLIRTGNKPLVIMLYGNPGIGKTETAKFLAKKLYDGEFIREQMSMVHGNDSLRYFKSTHHSEDSFSKKLLNRTSNVIILDEFARSPHYIQDSFLQMFDEGIYEDKNYMIDLNKAIIICTSNFTSRTEMVNNIDQALLSRFDSLIKYEDFSNEDKKLIIEKSIEEVKMQILPKYAEKVNWRILKGMIIDNIHGLTNMRHIKTTIEDGIADQILEKLSEINHSKMI